MMKQVPEMIRGLSRERAPQFYRLTKNTTPPLVVEVGQVWSTRSHLHLSDLPENATEEPRLVVILTGTGSPSSGLEQVTAAPVSLMFWLATDYDLIVPDNESPLNYRFMAEVWNETPVLKAHLRNCLGKLSERAITALRSIHIARLVGESLPTSMSSWVGLPLMGENDGRIAFQRSEIEAVEYLANVATAAVFAEMVVPDLSSESEGQRRQRLEIIPRFGNIHDFLRAPKRAMAASSSRVGSDMIIAYANDEVSLTLELLETRREDRVYLVVYDLSPELEGRVVVVTLVMTDGEIRLAPTELYRDSELEIGIIPGFDRTKVRRVDIEI